jgi:hypothetical protein
MASTADKLVAGVKRGDGFVGEQDGGLRRQRARDRDAGAFAAGKRRHRPADENVHLGRGHGARDRRAVGVGERGEGIGVRLASERHDSRDVERPVEFVALRQIGDFARPHPRRHRGCVARADRHLAVAGDEAGERAHQRGLAGPIRPHQHGQLAGVKREAGVLDDPPPAKDDRNAARG